MIGQILAKLAPAADVLKKLETRPRRSCRTTPNHLLMKTLISCLSALLLAGATVVPASAQVFRPETVSGALIGGLAGAVIGHNDGRHGWEGAAYGAAAGALIGTAVGHARDHRHEPRVHRYSPSYSYRSYGYPYRHGWASRPRWHVGVHAGHSPYWHRGYSHRHHHRHVRVYPSWAWRSGWYSDAWSYPHERGSYARRGALLGGLAGAIIGHNDGRHGWEGAAYGLGAGYLLGSIADAQARRAYETAPPVPVHVAPTATAAPQQVTIINNYYNAPGTPMSAANRVFGR